MFAPSLLLNIGKLNNRIRVALTLITLDMLEKVYAGFKCVYIVHGAGGGLTNHLKITRLKIL